ncbi:zinc-dependent metalloprotease [Paucibacter sp. B2R-40]|uniref:zinc-dependent metalloprotease n=1 Tax=Paucibacter sp. B2R-40 TaxID=2893554 RepID=UPI0021E4920E|nr:zinc-dependent metalloprotease [Paucibacter sp. B2R-40]MCV2355291.1 zinc-dependent metalloprotease [Paucibacter sp. B2R-40]
MTSYESPLVSRRLSLSAVAAAVALLSACATTTPEGAAPAAPSTAASPASPVAAAAPASAASAPNAAAKPPADPAAPKPFAEVSKDAKVQAGLFPIWRKDEKVWLEIPKAMIGKPFLFTVNIASAIGERGLYASQMVADQMVEWRRIGNQIQLVALNTAFRGEGGGKLAVAQAFSPSLLAAGPVGSAEHPQTKSILVDAGIFLTDIPGLSTRLEAAYRLPYAPDRSNSSFEASRADAKLSTLTARMHFFTPRIPAPPLVAPPAPVPTPPQTTPDPRSMFFSFVYNFQALPDLPMPVRKLDPRLGHFGESYSDFGSDSKANVRVHMVKRWRLEKQDANAELSEPIQPITYWLDKNIPPQYRAAVEAGILEWNKAFEKIGFKNAIHAKQQPDDADWDNMDSGHASIRWFVGADVGFAIGPNHADPRTGEILDADIGMSDVFARGSRRFINDDLGASPASPAVSALALDRRGHQHGAADYCSYANESAAEMGFALDLLEGRGDMAPDSPEAEAFVQAVIKDVITHEVGHTLGLKHNFKASTSVSLKQLQDKAYTERYGISNSVMDYNAYNLSLKGEPQGSLTNTTLGAYDYWAIEYAYKPLPAETEVADLAKIAARSTEPQLAYADDIDAGVGGPYDGFDPDANRFDLGDDPLAYFKRRLALSQELWARVQDRKPVVGGDPLRDRRSIVESFRQLARSAELTGKYVGGMHALRDLPGSTGRPAFSAVEPARQREALKFISTGLLSANSFRFRPEFLASQTLDYNEWERVQLSIPAAVGAVQATVLDRLMSANTARRLIDMPAFVGEKERKGLVSLSEVYSTLNAAVWSELKTGAEIDGMRRNLQREHLKRLQAVLTRGGGPGLLADAYAMVRFHAVQLQSDLRAASSKGGLSIETRAHLAESLDTLSSVLKANMQRS